MTLTVRLDPTLQAALEAHCASTGSSKSLVVQESLAAYLVQAEATRAAATGVPAAEATPGPAFRAFAEAGLVGGVALNLPAGTGSADKAAVRAQVAARRTAKARAG